jgi:AbrB family looped-hinge helix DNA binding protein
MQTTIDKAGRVVVPKSLRDAVSLRPGTVEIAVDGNGVRLQPPAAEHLAEEHGRLVVPSSGASLDDETVRALRDADQR